MGRSRKRKKYFKDCGHTGFGKFCHKCKQAKTVQTVSLPSNITKVEVLKPKTSQVISIPSIVQEAVQPQEKSFSKVSKISNIEVKISREVFGEKAFSPDRLVIVVWTENGARLPLLVPLGAKYENKQWNIYDKKSYNKSISWRQSKIGIFLKRYGSLPVIGLQVETGFSPKGYLVIDV